MKRLLAILLLVLALGIVSGCAPNGPKTERTARRIERRDLSIQSDLEGLPEDVETFWLTHDSWRLSRWQGH